MKSNPPDSVLSLSYSISPINICWVKAMAMCSIVKFIIFHKFFNFNLEFFFFIFHKPPYQSLLFILQFLWFFVRNELLLFSLTSLLPVSFLPWGKEDKIKLVGQWFQQQTFTCSKNFSDFFFTFVLILSWLKGPLCKLTPLISKKTRSFTFFFNKTLKKALKYSWT